MTCFSVYEAMFLFTNILMLRNDTSLHQYKNTNELFSVCVQPFYEKYSWLHSSIILVYYAIKIQNLTITSFLCYSCVNTTNPRLVPVSSTCTNIVCGCIRRMKFIWRRMRSMMASHWRVDGCWAVSSESIESGHEGRIVFEAIVEDEMKMN